MRGRGSWNGRLVLLVTLLAIAVSAFAAPDYGNTSEMLSFKGRTMGTTYSVKYLPVPAAPPTQQLKRAIERTLEQIEQEMSTYRPDSELSRFNQQSDTNWIAVSTNLAEVVKEAQLVSQATQGAFDVTIAPLVDLWGFGPERHTGVVPTTSAITSARHAVDYRCLQVRDSPPALRKLAPTIRIDLSGIAKGYAVDVIAQYLESVGLSNYLVQISGELRAGGHGAENTPWRVGIECPPPTSQPIQAVISLANMAISTSGDYRNYFEANDRRYCHIIDPRTGWPPQHELASVSVLDPSSARADALATALMVLGPETGFELANRQQLACLFILRTDKGLVEKRTEAFSRLQPPASLPANQPTLNQAVFK